MLKNRQIDAVYFKGKFLKIHQQSKFEFLIHGRGLSLATCNLKVIRRSTYLEIALARIPILDCFGGADE